jgi:hypothetical protein
MFYRSLTMTSPIAYRMSIACKRDQRAATQPALGSPLDLDGALATRNCVAYLQSRLILRCVRLDATNMYRHNEIQLNPVIDAKLGSSR